MSNHSIVDSNNLKFHKIMIPVIQSTITHKTLRFLFINSFFSQENDFLILTYSIARKGYNLSKNYRDSSNHDFEPRANVPRFSELVATRSPMRVSYGFLSRNRSPGWPIRSIMIETTIEIYQGWKLDRFKARLWKVYCSKKFVLTIE